LHKHNLCQTIDFVDTLAKLVRHTHIHTYTRAYNDGVMVCVCVYVCVCVCVCVLKQRHVRSSFFGLARTEIPIQCIDGIFGRDTTKYMVTYALYTVLGHSFLSDQHRCLRGLALVQAVRVFEA